MIKQYTRQIPVAWGHIEEGRKLVLEALAGHEQELRDAASITASELLENAVKYGSSVSEMPQVQFTLTVGGGEVKIAVSNGVSSKQNMAAVCAHIEAISAAPDKKALYVARVKKLVNAQESRTRLGLLRIAYEGGFELRCEHTEHVITIVARRGFQ